MQWLDLIDVKDLGGISDRSESILDVRHNAPQLRGNTVRGQDIVAVKFLMLKNSSRAVTSESGITFRLFTVGRIHKQIFEVAGPLLNLTAVRIQTDSSHTTNRIL